MKDHPLSEHFMLGEFLVSQTAARNGIDMTPPDYVVLNLERLCATVLEPVREIFRCPMHVSSGYRPPMLNQLVGGARTSAHMDGRAADIVFPGLRPSFVLNRLRSSTVLHTADQIIDEYERWVHFGIAEVDGQPRGQLLTARFVGASTLYRDVTNG